VTRFFGFAADIIPRTPLVRGLAAALAMTMLRPAQEMRRVAPFAVLD
jgi:hypothetical protein